MAEIVNSLFGVDPQQIMQQRQATDAANAYRYASLNPLQQAKMSIYQGSAGLGRGIGGLLGGDPELEKVSKIKQLSSQFDLTSPQGVRDFARELQSFAPQEAMMAAKRADEMTLNAATVEQKMREKTKPESSLGKLLSEKQQLIDAGLSANDPRVLAYDDAIQATGLTGKKSIAKASAPGGGPDTRGKAFELADPEALKEYRTGSRAASGQLALISQARENLPNAVVGQGLPALVRGLNAQLAPLGINTETVANTRNLEQALKSIIAQGIKAYGANPSTVDLQFAIQAAADIKDPQKAIDATLNYLEQKATKAVDKADAAEQWLLTKGNLAGFEKDWNKQVNTPKNKPKTITLPSGVVVTVGE